MQEIKIVVNKLGTLMAVCPDGKTRVILVDVHDLQHYGVLTIGTSVEKKEDE